ncbi:hypothetical protein CHELA1G11_20581 [Hyphomicrobiales bacterium]|nr:hypothetical protein CHELA1G11_20581 [Hyphomicrobiales bacterium]
MIKNTIIITIFIYFSPNLNSIRTLAYSSHITVEQPALNNAARLGEVLHAHRLVRIVATELIADEDQSRRYACFGECHRIVAASGDHPEVPDTQMISRTLNAVLDLISLSKSIRRLCPSQSARSGHCGAPRCR